MGDSSGNQAPVGLGSREDHSAGSDKRHPNAPIAAFRGRIARPLPCRPVPADQAEQLAIQVPELVLRTEPAHREAVPLQASGGFGDREGLRHGGLGQAVTQIMRRLRDVLV